VEAVEAVGRSKLLGNTASVVECEAGVDTQNFQEVLEP
jgi:hypothetical protein